MSQTWPVIAQFIIHKTVMAWAGRVPVANILFADAFYTLFFFSIGNLFSQ